MKYIRKYNEAIERSIEDWCVALKLKDFHINDNNSIDVYTNVDIDNKGLKKFPIKFNEIRGYFSCRFNGLETLENGPIELSGGYYCENNNIRSLNGYPKKIGIEFSFNRNPVYNLYAVFGRSLEKYKASLDFNYFRENYTCIIRRRFELACKEADVSMPNFIPEYEYID
jgi:hypothetical protein